MDTSNAVLGIYLNDHLGGATMGVELFRRASRSAQGPVKTQLEELTMEVEQDRESLRTLMGTLGLPVHRYKALVGSRWPPPVGKAPRSVPAPARPALTPGLSVPRGPRPPGRRAARPTTISPDRGWGYRRGR